MELGAIGVFSLIFPNSFNFYNSSVLGGTFYFLAKSLLLEMALAI